jgi:hypothetical protein
MLEFSKSHWHGTGVLDFDQARRWFATNWGWSQDTVTQQTISQFEVRNQGDALNLLWSYSVAYKDYRIYVATDKELAFFQLVHPSQES